MTVFSGTGHRPPKLGGYQIQPVLVDFAEMTLIKLGATKVISGMALGWDQALAEAAVNLGRPWVAAIPFSGQESKWPQASQDKYHALLAQASDQVLVSQGGYSPQAMQIRNQWMVDNADWVLALWNGSRGGTYNCIQYASEQDVPIANVYKPWVKFRQS